MTKEYKDSWRIINMDNWFSSIVNAIDMSKKGLHVRATIRSNRRGMAKCTVFTDAEITKYGRGNFRYASEPVKKIVSFGWIDCKALNIISTVDGSKMDTVVRQIGKTKKRVQSPVAIKEYNKNMQGVDRFDQLLSLFSISSRHTFNHFYISLMMIGFDIALLQGWLHYQLKYPVLCEHTGARVDFYESIAKSFIETDWSSIATHPDEMENEEFLHSEAADVCHPVLVRNDLFHPNKKHLMHCQICQFEGRGNINTTVHWCRQCKVRMCTGKIADHVPNGVWKDRYKSDEKVILSDWNSWICQNRNWSCWDKYHRFYKKQGLFMPPTTNSLTVNFRQSCKIYKRRNIVLGRNSNKGRSKRSKSQSNVMTSEVLRGNEHHNRNIINSRSFECVNDTERSLENEIEKVYHVKEKYHAEPLTEENASVLSDFGEI